MENATKALLIAAAVLVAILIISLGLVIYNMASETIDGAGDLSEYQIQQFNEKFTKYVNTSASGSDVNAMIKTIFNHNQAQEDATTMVSYDGVDGDIDADNFDGTTSPGKESTGSRYTVTITFDENSKLVDTITATANN